jgi:hypothetical protein
LHVIAPDRLAHQVNETLDALCGCQKAQQLQQLVAGRCSGLEIKWLVRDCL